MSGYEDPPPGIATITFARIALALVAGLTVGSLIDWLWRLVAG